jgi:hypothetical protein
MYIVHAWNIDALGPMKATCNNNTGHTVLRIPRALALRVLHCNAWFSVFGPLRSCAMGPAGEEYTHMRLHKDINVLCPILFVLQACALFIEEFLPLQFALQASVPSVKAFLYLALHPLRLASHCSLWCAVS